MCYICGYRAKLRGNLNIHIRNVHHLQPHVNNSHYQRLEKGVQEPDSIEAIVIQRLPEENGGDSRKDVDPTNKCQLQLTLKDKEQNRLKRVQTVELQPQTPETELLK